MRRRIVCGMMVGIVGSALLAPLAQVGANDEWCWDDPTVSFFDAIVDVEVQVPLHQRQHIKQVTVKVLAPEGVPLTASPVSGNYYPITFSTGTLPDEHRRKWDKGDKVPVEMRIAIRAGDDTPVRLVVKVNNVVQSDRTHHVSESNHLSLTHELIVPT